LATCTVVYEGKLIAGKDGGKAEILGGTAIATKDFEVKTLGCHIQVATVVEVSTSPKLVALDQEHAKEISRVERNLDDIQKSLGYLKKQASARSDERIGKLSKAYFTLSQQLETFSRGSGKFDGKDQG
jgi:uncharacterized protein (DUF342 family)